MRHLMCWMLLLAAPWGAGVVLPAQQQFRTTTSLLTLDVSVLDDDGNPVTDLGPEDFVVTLNDARQPVRAMVFLAARETRTTGTEAPTAGAPVAPVPPAAASQAGAEGEPDPKLIVILVDDASIHPTDSKGLFVAAERFVDAIPPGDWVGLASTSGRMTVNPSRDRVPLLADLRRAFGWMNDPRRERRPFVGLMDALEVDAGSQAAFRDLLETSCGLSQNLIGSKNLGEILAQYDCASDVQRVARDNATYARLLARTQLDTYVALIKAMASAPGVKQLVILTGGIAVKPSDARDFEPMAEAAAAAGVQISMLMEEPDDGDFSNPDARALARDQRQMMQQTQTLAEMSGGQFFRVIGQADRFYRRVLTSASAIYRIGVDLPPDVPPDGRYKVAVTVTRPRVKVLASRYAVPPPPPIALSPDEQMQRAVRTGELSFGVPVRMTAEVVSVQATSPTAIRVHVDVPADRPRPVTGIFGMTGSDGLLRSLRRELVQKVSGGPYQVDLLVPAASGTYDLRFAATDGSGAVGAVVQRVVVK
ncbi:MAG: VWA domain-containing protein [Vicinamibacterales bacterium]